MNEHAFGRPGLRATWASARKQAVGTALSERSRVWFTIAEGILTEVITVDCPNQQSVRLFNWDSVVNRQLHGGESFYGH